MKALLSWLNVKPIIRWLILCVSVGVLSGFGAIVLFFMIKGAGALLLDYIGGFKLPMPAGEGGREAFFISRRWLILILPTFGGLVSGILVTKFAPDARGDGTDATIDVFHRARGRINLKSVFIKGLASAFVIGSGGSAGREGPVTHIGAGLGSFLAQKLHLTDKEKRIFLLAGAGGGLGAIFKAPIGGALFACEVLYRECEFESEAIIPAIISSVVAYSIFSSVYGWEKLYSIPDISFVNPLELIFYAMLGVFCAICGFFYLKILRLTKEKLFSSLNLPEYVKPAFGGFLLGSIALFVPQIIGPGYGFVQLALWGKMTGLMMLTVGILKMFATAFTLSSGGSGGIFAPSLCIGAMLGGAFGHAFNYLFPHLIKEPFTFVLVGMASFFGGIARVPISAVIIVSELSGGYNLLVPLILVSAISMIFFRGDSLYENQVGTKIDSPAHLGDFTVDILSKLTVKDAYNSERRYQFIPEDMKLEDILKVVTQTTSNYFPVINREGDMVGIFSMNDIRKILYDRELLPLVIARDVMVEDVITTTLDETLSSVLEKFSLGNIDELPVVDKKSGKKVLGMITRRDLLLAYTKELERRKRR